MFESLLEWDRETFLYLNALGIEKYDTFWAIVTEITTWIPLFLLFVVLLLWKFPKQEAIFKLLTFLLLVASIITLTHLVKTGVARIRPNNAEGINVLARILKSPTDYSFFSGHASSSFSITVLMFLFLRKKLKWAIWFFIWPLLFSMSRIYVGVHYPSDIFVGALVGVLVGILFYRLHDRAISLYTRSARPE